MSGGQGPTTADRIAVISRRVVFVGGLGLSTGAVLAILNDQMTLGIALFVVTFVAVMGRALMTVVRGWRALAGRKRAQAPVGPVRAADTPAPVEDVVAALLSMNSDDLPYAITTSDRPGGVRIEVRWKYEELRWQTLFVRGSQVYAWRMEIDLDPSKAHYRFVEYSGQASTRSAAGPLGVEAKAMRTWRKGKTFGGTSATFVEGADGQITVIGSTGPRTSWEGAVMIKPAAAKVPVFTLLRNNGWRPRRDWFGARLFER